MDDARFETLRRRVAAAVRRACPGWLADQADDIVQAVMVQLVKYASRGEGNRRYTAIYLEKAAYGATVDEIRRRCRRKENPIGDAQVLEQAPDTGADPLRRIEAAEIGRAIRECLTRMVTPRRLAVTLYLQGCSVPETGRRMGWEAKRAENLVYRGLADLRRCLNGKGMSR
jgi:RNA polymerase sigma-70 factor (ECF subfamily)